MTTAIKWTNLDNCMPRRSKDYEVKPAIGWKKEFHERMKDLKREVFLKTLSCRYVLYKPVMIIIDLMLALVETPTMTWT